MSFNRVAVGVLNGGDDDEDAQDGNGEPEQQAAEGLAAFLLGALHGPDHPRRIGEAPYVPPAEASSATARCGTTYR